MIVASLLVRTVVAIQARPLGFDPSDVLTVQIELPEGDYSEDGDAERFFAQARDRVGAVPGFSDVQLTNVLPGADFGALRSLEVEGLDWPEERAAPTAFFTTASAGFFDALGLDVQSGRTFEQTDNAESFLVAVVSRAIASEYWPEQDPLGRRFRRVGEEAWIQVVGVVADVRSTGDTDQTSPNVYVPHAQDERRSMYLVARTTREPSAVAGPIRDAIWGIDSQLPLGAIRTLERAHYENSASTYALITLFVTFAVFALLMAAVGIYGVMAYSVSQRRAEIGLRMALGAEASAVRWMIVSQGARLMVAGVVIGLLAAFAMSRLLANLVFGVSPTDPLTFIGVPLVLMSVALVANMIPARRATRTDPATTLRAD
jgi:putative ABC transport system permease protein